MWDLVTGGKGSAVGRGGVEVGPTKSGWATGIALTSVLCLERK